MLKDNRRKWLWGLLAFVVMSQLYVVRELVAVFALFTLGFATIAFVVASLYMLYCCWELAVLRLVDIRRSVMNVAPVRHENQKAAEGAETYSRHHMLAKPASLPG